MTTEQRIEASRARLAKLETKSNKLWDDWKAQEAALEPQKALWLAAHYVAAAERERLAGLLQIAEEDAQAISVVPESANRVEAV